VLSQEERDKARRSRRASVPSMRGEKRRKLPVRKMRFTVGDRKTGSHHEERLDPGCPQRGKRLHGFVLRGLLDTPVRKKKNPAGRSNRYIGKLGQ